MKTKELKLKRHETFSIREGWLEKGLHYINQDERCMSKELGTKIFGLGSNMVKSLRYWLIATNIAFFKNGNAYLSDFGELLLNNDPYLDEIFSIWLIHINLSTNEKEAPVFNAVFNLGYSQFDKQILLEKVPDKLIEYGFNEVENRGSLESDIMIFLKSYFSDEVTNPENNITCPLSKLELFNCDEKKFYTRKNPFINKLDYRIVYLSILKCLENVGSPNEFNIEDLYSMKNNPIILLNITKSSLFYYLDELQKKNYIKLNKTAGLNVARIVSLKSFNEVAEEYYQEVTHNVR